MQGLPQVYVTGLWPLTAIPSRFTAQETETPPASQVLVKKYIYFLELDGPGFDSPE